MSKPFTLLKDGEKPKQAPPPAGLNDKAQTTKKVYPQHISGTFVVPGTGDESKYKITRNHGTPLKVNKNRSVIR